MFCFEKLIKCLVINCLGKSDENNLVLYIHDYLLLYCWIIIYFFLLDYQLDDEVCNIHNYLAMPCLYMLLFYIYYLILKMPSYFHLFIFLFFCVIYMYNIYMWHIYVIVYFCFVFYILFHQVKRLNKHGQIYPNRRFWDMHTWHHHIWTRWCIFLI